MMSFRIRESLVWNTSKPTLDTCCVSPAFDLINSKWRLELKLSPKKTNDTYPKFHISLRNCSETQSFSPFEVKVLLEDRRQNVQKSLSSLNVSSTHEILYSTTFLHIKTLLPGLDEYDDITVVCIFKPSTGLKLPLITENGSSFKVRQSLIWETEKPPEKSEYLSPVFALNNTIWRLCIKSDSMHFDYLYRISIKKCSAKQSFESFDVTTFIEGRRSDDQMQCSKLSIRSATETLCSTTFKCIYKRLPELKYSDDITIVCIFSSPIIELSLCVKKESVMRISEMECSEFRNESNLIENKKRISSYAYPSSKRLLSLESLSENLGNLLDKSLMTDIQVKCGGDIIPAHKAVLAARSRVFSDMFKHETVESKSGIIDIKDVEPFVLRTLLRYFYTGEISEKLSECEICKLYELSDKYEDPVLQTLCSSYMTRMLKEENIIDFLKLADEYNDKDLKDGITEFITENPLFLRNDIWISFSGMNPTLALEIYQKHITKTT